MLNLFESIMFGFKQVLKWNMMKIALISGLLLSAVWVLIGFLLWDHLISFSSSIIEMIPFSMVRSNSAEIISAFVWMQVVLITFALIVAFFGTLFSKKIPRERYSYFYITIIACSVIFWTFVWFFEGDYLHVEFARVINWLPFGTIDKGMSYLVSGLMIYNAIIVSMLLVASLLSETILVKINEEYFDNEYISKKEFKIVGYTLRDALIYIVASIVLFPLFFVPYLNFIIQIGLWTYLVKNTFKYDIGFLLSKDMDGENFKKEDKAIWFISFISSFFNFLPVVNVFGPFFGEISIFHYLKNCKE